MVTAEDTTRSKSDATPEVVSTESNATHDNAGKPEYPGAEILERAMRKRLSMQTRTDMDEVIGLISSALSEGIPEEDRPFTEEMLAYLLFQRAVIRLQPVLAQIDPDQKLDHTIFSENTELKLAMTDLEEAVKLNPKLIEGWIRIATLRLASGGDENRQLAMDAVNQAVEQSRGEPTKCVEALGLRSTMRETVDEKLADLDEALAMIPTHQKLRQMRAMVLVEVQRNEEALEELNRVINDDPSNVPTIVARAQLLLLMERPAEAVASLDAVLASGNIEEPAMLLFEKAKLLADQEQYEASLKALRQIIAANPSALSAYLLRISVYQKMKKYDEALADLDRLMMVAPRSLDLIRMKMFVLLQADRTDEAEEYATQVLGSRRNEPDVLRIFASIEVSRECYEAAIDILDELLRMRPNDPDSLLMRGNAASGLGRHAEAKLDYKKALEAAPEEPLILNNYAWLLATAPQDDLRDGAQALELALKACELTEYKEAYILSTLGAAYAETGDFEKAKEFSRKAGEANKDTEKNETYEKELKTYEEGRPFREERIPTRHRAIMNPIPADAAPDGSESEMRDLDHPQLDTPDTETLPVEELIPVEV